MSLTSLNETEGHYQPLKRSFLSQAFGDTKSAATMNIAITLILALLVNYAIEWLKYLYQRRHVSPNQLPPTYPTFIPFLGHLLSLLIIGPSFLGRASTYAGHLTCSRLTLVVTPVYILQDPSIIRALWKSPALASPMALYVYVLDHFFGMRSAALKVYRADDSGPFRKPHSGSTVLEKDRVGYITHSVLLTGLTGVGLGPFTTRTVGGMLGRVKGLETGVVGGWVEKPDLFTLMVEVIGRSVMEALAGPAFLELNPSFVDEFWEFDKTIPWFGHGIPAFLMPRATRRRERLKAMMIKWHRYARERCEEGTEVNGDLAWGSSLMRDRQETLGIVDGLDEDAMAAVDLGLVWASVANVVPSTVMATYHLFTESGLLERIRAVLADGTCRIDGSGFDLKALVQIPLLSSIYAETLRVYTNSYFATNSPHSATPLGQWMLPKGGIAMVNSRVSHMDPGVWNKTHPSYPAQTFWPDRFLNAKGEFSLEGLDGSWLPYGGGNAICPGRFLAKNIIILGIALMADRFDLEIMNKSVDMDMGKLGLGVLRPNKTIPFRVRRRYDGERGLEKEEAH
ncbi:cytochrome P450 [Lophium mytilinum]|uniref:Cytochrome P450 n=1 Tax=Lophium mytilinum TaxID=390894 RepID=A0A6A6QEN2_9PEZI|nr:cytochrome P450 [Lophium mytilinum]